MSDKLKNDAINMAKSMLAEIPFNTIYSYADNLFDKAEVAFGDDSIKAEVDFLKKTKLSDLEYENTEARDFFTMKNRLTGESIRVSNRDSTRGELRAQLLRAHLDKQSQEKPNQTVYDTITSAIKTPEYSDMVTMLKGALSTGTAAKTVYLKPMSEDHFALFNAILLRKVNEKIANQKIKSDLEPREIRNKPELQEEIWKDIDVDLIFDTTRIVAVILQKNNEKAVTLNTDGSAQDVDRIFNATQILVINLQKIKEKAVTLNTDGYTEAGKAANVLHDNLTTQKDNFINGKISVRDFATNCGKLIEEAQKGELKNHRGFFGIIWHGILTALNVLTAGAISIKPTDSIQKTIDLKKSIFDMSKVTEPAPSGPDVTDVNPSPESQNKIR